MDEPRVRPMEGGDVAEVAELEERLFGAPWSAATFRGLLGRPGVDLQVVEAGDGSIAGYSVMTVAGDHAELANLAVRPDLQGRGLGSLLLERLVRRARAQGVRALYLEVRVSNERAAGMYERRGFLEVGRRRDYYRRPREDARVLLKRLDAPDPPVSSHTDPSPRHPESP